MSASFAAGRGTGARRGVRRRGAGERLGLADREVAVDHLPRQRLRVRRGDEGPGVTGGQAAVAQHGEHRLGQGQQPQQVGDVAAALAERLGQPLLGVAEAVHQLPVALRLLERVEVGALHVLDDRQLEHLGVGERRAPPPAAHARRRAAPPASAARRRRSRSRRRRPGAGAGSAAGSRPSRGSRPRGRRVPSRRSRCRGWFGLARMRSIGTLSPGTERAATGDPRRHWHIVDAGDVGEQRRETASETLAFHAGSSDQAVSTCRVRPMRASSSPASRW